MSQLWFGHVFFKTTIEDVWAVTTIRDSACMYAYNCLCCLCISCSYPTIISWPMPPLCLHNIQQPLGHPSPNMQTEIKQVKIHQTLKSGENFPESSRVWRAWKVDVLVFSLNNCLKITPTISNFPAILPETGSIIFQWPAGKNGAAFKKMLGNSMEFT